MDKQTMHEQYEALKTHYKVYNLVNKYKEVFFILESPHIDELLNQAPVSGLSGKAMSNILFDGEKTPIGIKLKQMPEHTIGILNVCNIPMQRAAYVDEKVQSTYGVFDANAYNDFFDVVEKLRTGTKAVYKDTNRNDMQEIILANFREELMKLKDKELVMIPCGKTAEVFFEIAGVESDKWTVLVGTPHPSFGNWHKAKYQSKIEEVKNAVEKTN